MQNSQTEIKQTSKVGNLFIQTHLYVGSNMLLLKAFSTFSYQRPGILNDTICSNSFDFGNQIGIPFVESRSGSLNHMEY